METRDAVALIAAAVGESGGVWADIGAGSGTFTRALARILDRGSAIYAVDVDASSIAAIRDWAAREAANVTAVKADFTGTFELPGSDSLLDGMLLANSLHFVANAPEVLKRLAKRVRVGGRIVFVEYEQRSKSRWVPYPIPIARLKELAAAAGLSEPTVTATQPSAYVGVLYAASADRIA